MSYSDYTTEDFILDEDFIRWVKNPNQDNNAYWKTFISKYPHLKDRVHQAREIILMLEIKGNDPAEGKFIEIWGNIIRATEQNPVSLAQLKNSVERRIHYVHESPIKELPGSSGKGRVKYHTTVGIAASVVLVVTVFIFLFATLIQKNSPTTSFHSPNNESGTVTIKNTDNKAIKPVRLADGSLVVLQPNSEIHFDQSFASDKRELTLIGEAFFEIAKNPDHPFLVHSLGIVTKVLGTSFNIKAKQGDKTIVVDVKTGKVAVYREKRKVTEAEYHLTPNQQVIYDRSSDKIVQQLQKDPRIIVTEKEINEMKFEEAPAVEVFEALKKAYGIDIVYDKISFANCTLTTHISSEGLYTRLGIICKALGAEYETKGTTVYLKGNGCE